MELSLTPLRVLIIEDCEYDRDLLLLRLRQAGFRVDAEAVETLAEIELALAKDDWQIILSDFDLPGFDGLRAFELVRQHNPEVPFFIVSGVLDEEQAVAALRAGAQDYFFKGKLARLGPAINRELKEAEQRRRRNEAQNALDRDRNILRHDRIRFIDVMSHEFRTPLNIIHVAASMLARYGDRMDADGRRERISEIKDSVARMTRTIEKVLLTSRLEMHRWELKSETLNLAAWCADFLGQFAADKQRILLTISNVADEIAMDPRVLEIALQNVLSNALKYSPPDSPIQFDICGDGCGRVRFTIRDRGIGILDADMPFLLTSFQRGSNVGSVQGTGLGLAIVKGCMDIHDGTIDIQSKPGIGTSVTISLPDGLRLSKPLRDMSPAGPEVIPA